LHLASFAHEQPSEPFRVEVGRLDLGDETLHDLDESFRLGHVGEVAGLLENHRNDSRPVSGRPGEILRGATVATTAQMCTILRMTMACGAAKMREKERNRRQPMRSFGLTPTETPERRLLSQDVTHSMSVAWRETFAAVAVVLVGLVALAFVLVVLPWVISI
jgi:hypothetical protein